VKPTALLAALLLLGACSKNIQTNEAVRESVVSYLSAIAAEKGLDISAMDVEVAKVSFERDEATATIAIRPKNVPGSTPMQIGYTLDRKGDKWVVRGATQTGATPHGETAPSAAPGALPPGHPTMTGTPPAGALPAGHPPIETTPGTKQ
jgi:hypothetical protein